MINSLRKASLFGNFPEHIKKMSSINAGKYKIQEVDGDLFSAPKNVSLAHCVAADLKMGAGIAIKFRDTFKQIDTLKAQNSKIGGLAVLKDDERWIYYLITKTSTYDKPTLATLTSSLVEMKKHMTVNNVTTLAIPRIGCGLDGLNWPEVKACLNDVFEKEPIEITVYNFVRK